MAKTRDEAFPINLPLTYRTGKGMRYFMDISYYGNGFSGWQVQPGEPTIQQCLELALQQILGAHTPITGAGRTDTGVHARLMTAHVDNNKDLTDIRFKNSLNAVLDPRIAINQVYAVAPDAHARFSATSRTYRYVITRRKDPFLIHKAYPYTGQLDLEAMRSCCPLLAAHRDFQSFSKVHTDVNHFDCNIFHAEWHETEHVLVFEIRANRFLRNMVRAIVGTMLDVGRGRLDPAGFNKVIEYRDRSRAGWSVPACGLYLWEIEYPEHIFANK